MERSPPPSPPSLDEARIQDDRAKAREPFFHGREAEFEMFRKSARNLALGNLGDRTLVYQGPPGSGKTALMEEITAMVGHHAKTTGEPWIAVNVMPSELADSARVAQRVIETFIAERVPETSMGSKLRKFRNKVALRVTLAGSIEFSAKNTTSLSSVLETNLSGLVEQIGSTRVVLCVDEASNMCHADGDAKATRAMLERLHMPPKLGQARWHVLPVFFGLSDTTNVLANLKLSRLTGGNTTTLALLNDTESKAVIRDVCDTYGIKFDSSDTERFINAGQGWPQHLKIITIALLDRLSKTGGSFTRDDMSEIFTDVENYKLAYYTGIRQRMKFAHRAVKEIAKQCEERGQISNEELDTVLIETGTDNAEFQTEALRSGFLAPHGAEGYVIPIPSLQTDILGTADKAREQDTGR